MQVRRQAGQLLLCSPSLWPRCSLWFTYDLFFRPQVPVKEGSRASQAKPAWRRSRKLKTWPTPGITRSSTGRRRSARRCAGLFPRFGGQERSCWSGVQRLKKAAACRNSQEGCGDAIHRMNALIDAGGLSDPVRNHKQHSWHWAPSPNKRRKWNGSIRSSRVELISVTADRDVSYEDLVRRVNLVVRDFCLSKALGPAPELHPGA